MVECPRCKRKQPEALANLPGYFGCSGCGAEIKIFAFPALRRETAAVKAAAAMADESSCFFHPSKQAIHPCDFCGRFLCSLCDLPIGDQHLCPHCLSAGKDKGKVVEANKGHTRYDRLALFLAVIPLLIWPFTLISAPIALYFSGRYYSRQQSLIPINRWRFVTAGFLSLFQVGGWSFFFVSILW